MVIEFKSYSSLLTRQVPDDYCTKQIKSTQHRVTPDDIVYLSFKKQPTVDTLALGVCMESPDYLSWGSLPLCLENRLLQKSFGPGFDYGCLVSGALLIPHEQWLNRLRKREQVEKTGHAPACACL